MPRIYWVSQNMIDKIIHHLTNRKAKFKRAC